MIKKNLKTLFIFVILGFVILAFTLTWERFQSIQTQVHNELIADTQLYHSNFNSRLNEVELILDILGSRLLEDNAYLDQDNSQTLMRSLLKTKQELAGFGLTDPNGNFISISGNMDINSMPNLLKNEISSAAFKNTLTSERMVVGRTYYFPPLKQWVIPMRKALKNEFGEIVAVMTTGIKLEGDYFSLFGNIAANKTLVLLNDDGYYRTFISEKNEGNLEELYLKPVPSDILNRADREFISHHDSSMSNLKKLELPIAVEVETIYGGLVDLAIKYNSTYKIWTIYSQPKKYFWDIFLDSLVSMITITLLSLIIIVWLFREINTYEKQARKRLFYQATHDHLTDLPNRNFLEKNYSFSTNGKKPLALLFLDLDNFKNINDNFGHAIGDQILKVVAYRLGKIVADSDTLIRFGGDEFLIVLEGQKKDAKAFANKIISALSKSFEIEQMRFDIGGSIGIARYPQDALSMEELITLADIAMYEAKRKKNTIQIFDEAMRTRASRKVQVELNLRKAVDNHEVFMVYQPQMTSEGRVHGVEALVRWQNPQLGLVRPDEFIFIAEEVGLMPSIGHHIMTKSFSEMSKLQKELQIQFRVSVNVSVRQFMEPKFYESFIEAIFDSGLKADQITLEVTESLFIEELSYVLPILEKIRAQGIWLSMDDFGTGYSSLSLLKNLPIDELKIDKAFTDDLLNQEQEAALIESIIEMGHKLSIEVLAEGVETLQQVDALKAYGCNLVQGYYFAKPMSKDDVKQFIVEHREFV